MAYVDGSISLWDMADGTLLHTRPKVAEQVYTLDWSPAGDLLVTAGLRGKIILWDSRDLTSLKELDAPEWVIQVRFNPEGTRLFISGGMESPPAIRKVVVWGLPE